MPVNHPQTAAYSVFYDVSSVDEALRRAELYMKADADGVYAEAVESEEELEKTAWALRGVPLATSILEGGGRTPWMDPKELKALGYSMLLYPKTVIFRVTRAIQKAVNDLKAGRPMPADDSVTSEQYEDMLRLPAWADLENSFLGTDDPFGVPSRGGPAVTSREPQTVAAHRAAGSTRTG